MRISYKHLGIIGLGALFFTLLALEKKRPLRRAVDDKRQRAAVNSVVAGVSSIFLIAGELPVTRGLTKLVERKRLGILPLLPKQARILAGLLLLDYTIYLWHVMLHKLPTLWRFHISHHTDRDLDVLTAMRFHFGELLYSVLFRSAQILLIGVSWKLLNLWQILLAGSILFHHSNVRLPEKGERVLNFFVMSPRLHGIHHSENEDETNSNWSSGLTVWDRLHGTFREQAPKLITIGVPAFSESDDTTLLSTLALPFKHPRPSLFLSTENGATALTQIGATAVVEWCK